MRPSVRRCDCREDVAFNGGAYCCTVRTYCFCLCILWLACVLTCNINRSGRGKSAAMGLSIAGAIAYEYSNVFVTAPSPENLKTLFEMVFKGMFIPALVALLL